ncbi:MOP flippase family protein [Segetibacter aerophilus]|uniref:Lipopolysaccharide biosynthesis protein n=1 Tax=Segetibacter aerophilus TaxID=670293 RepID=A0A512BFP6_9BACT|nr:MOP flippase family protein [Segetibacter aerophilus]GEO10782.1 lipopolysaccharide biosynthesis protein [Segetibacter aerophilus]
MSNKKKAINGGKWITISTVISTVFQFMQVAILARLLNPSAFGVVSISTLIIAFFNIFTNLGFSNSIIYKQEQDRKVLSTLYFLNLILGVIIFIAIYFSAPLIIAYYKEAKLSEVIKLSSTYFLIVYFGQIYYFLLEKELQFKSVAVIEIIGAVVGTTVTITLAYSGFEELSLIYGQLSMQAVRTILQIILGRKYFVPKLYFNIFSIKEHLQFGIYNVADGFIGFIQSNADNIIIGGVLGVKMLGYYTIAIQLAVFPITKLNPIVLQVTYPLLAKMKDNLSGLKTSYLTILDFLSYINLPLLAGLFITADSVVPLFYGPGWEQTIALIKIFVFISFFSCLGHPLYTLAFTRGKPKLLFYLNLATLAVKIPLLYVFSKYWGVTGIAMAFLTATFINLVLNFCIVHHLIGDFIKMFLRNLLKPVFFCLLMIAIIYAYKMLVGYTGIINTITQVCIGGIIYGVLTLIYKISLSEIKALKKAI